MTPHEHEALLRTRALLAAPGTVSGAANRCPREPHEFSMQIAYYQHGCGTVACIGGWLAKFMALPEHEISDYVYTRHSKDLTGLFFPDDLPSLDALTPRLAVEAIDNFLSGMPPWAAWADAWEGSEEEAQYIAETNRAPEVWSRDDSEEDPR